MIRFCHINGASIFFTFIYLHLFRGMFYQRALHKSVWVSGVAILLVLIAISFLGYVLPWGQISYWAVAVITNLFSVVPVLGGELVQWIWGGFSVRNPTLTRFYSLHFILPFVLAAIVIAHLIALHKNGSRNSLGLNRNLDKVEFHPYFTTKDLVFIVMAMLIALGLRFFQPFALGDSVNNIPANYIRTPAHIQPEWYFLPSYAILRGLPNKTAGVLALALSVRIFFVIPAYRNKFSVKFSSARNLIFWVFVSLFTFLIIIGAIPAEEPFVTARKVGSMIYFSRILLINL